jgi:hypothetical protein
MNHAKVLVTLNVTYDVSGGHQQDSKDDKANLLDL